MAIKDTNIAINISDTDKSIAFYQNIGYSIKDRWWNLYAQLGAPGLVIGLHPSSDFEYGSGNVSIGFTSTHFDESKLLLIRKSIAFTESTEAGGHFVHFHDPDGTALYFIHLKY